MFLKYSGMINLDQVIEDEYNYVFDGNLTSFYEQDFVELEGDGKDALCWIVFNGERYLFKPLEEFEYNVWGELLSQEIAKKLNIPCASYRAGILHGQKGIISKSFLDVNDTLVLGSEIFQEFFNRRRYNNIYENLLGDDNIIRNYQIPDDFKGMNSYNQKRYTFNYLNNLEQVWSILEDDYSINSKDISLVIQFMSKMLLFDLITLQGDRHPNNWGIIKNGNKIKASPLYDNGASFGLGFPFMERRIINFRSELANSMLLKDDNRIYSIIYQVSPNFTLSQDNVIDIKKRGKDKIPKVLDDFMRKSDLSIRKEITDTLSVIQSDDLDDIIKKLEKVNDIRMDANLYYYVMNIFELNLKKMKSIVNSYWEVKEGNESKKSSRTI